MNRICLLLSACFSGLAALTASSVELPDGIVTYKSDWAPKGDTAWVWTDVDGQAMAWTNGNYVIVTAINTGNFGITKAYSFYGLQFDCTPPTGTWIDGDGCVTLGAGGLTFANGGCFRRGRGYAIKHINLAADQVWENKSTTQSAEVSLGHDAYVYREGGVLKTQYTRDYMGADEDVHSLTLRGDLSLWLYYTNQLSEVDVRLESPAQLRLSQSFNNGGMITNSPALNARKLTLAGDGERYRAGGDTTSKPGYRHYLLKEMNAVTIAPTLELEDGADLRGSDGVFAIPALTVKGMGTSEFLGNWTFANADTAVTLADGATLRFTGTVGETSPAGLTVGGTGTVVIDNATWGLTGPITIGENVTLEIVNYTRFSNPIRGNGKIKVAAVGDCPRLLSTLTTLAEYEGTSVTVTGGTVLFESQAAMEEAGIAVTVEGSGAAVYGGAADKIVTNVPFPDPTCTVEKDETVLVYGNGLTADKSLVLNGGSIRFLEPATIASPVSVTASSWIETDAASITGRVTGVITSAVVTEEKMASCSTSAYGLCTRGAGTIVFTGGGTFPSSRDGLWVVDGDLVLSGGVWTFSEYSNLGTAYSAIKSKGGTWGKTFQILDGAQVSVSKATLCAQGRDDGGSAKDASEIIVDGDATLVTFATSGGIKLGANQACGKLRVRGGRVLLNKGTAIWTGSANISAGEVHLEGGVLEINRSVLRPYSSTPDYQGMGVVVWNGGTLKVGADFESPLLFNTSETAPNETTAQYFRLKGKIEERGGVLDLADLKASVLTNCPPQLDRTEWYGTGELTVRGGKRFVMNAYPNAASIRVAGDGTEVVISEVAQVYDYAKCVENESFSPYQQKYSAAGSVVEDLSVVACTFAGKGATLTSEGSARQVTVGDVFVTADGAFDNLSLTAAGGLEATNLTFAADATLGAALAGAATQPFELVGTLTLPATLGYASRKLAPSFGDFVVFRAATLTGDPAWTKVGGAHFPEVSAAAGTVTFRSAGTVLLIR